MFPIDEIFSRKVFLGGLPLDITEKELKKIFNRYGVLHVEWSSRAMELSPNKLNFASEKEHTAKTGYAFLIFMEEVSVRRLIADCYHVGNYYYIEIVGNSARPPKLIQIRPWRLFDMDYIPNISCYLNPRHTVFIGALPRTTKANELAYALESKFGPVCYVGIDTDPDMKYPKGAARATFNTFKSYMAAMAGRYVEIPNSDGMKRVEIKPYVLNGQICDNCYGKLCSGRTAPYFCSEIGCLQYYCEVCWDQLHYADNNRVREHHKPFVKLGGEHIKHFVPCHKFSSIL